MDSNGCECTSKSINNLENAIEYLMNRGRQVNEILNAEKLRSEGRKLEELESLKKKVKPAISCRKLPVVKKRTIHNKQTGSEELIDFDVPSLDDELSQKSVPTIKSTNVVAPKSASHLRKNTTVTETTTSIRSKKYEQFMTVKDHYLVDKGDRTEAMPSIVKIKQLPDDSIDLIYSFLNEKGQQIFNVEMNVRGEIVKKLAINGKPLTT